MMDTFFCLMEYIFCSEYHYEMNITGRNNMDGVLTVVLMGTKGNSSPIKLMTYVDFINFI